MVGDSNNDNYNRTQIRSDYVEVSGCGITNYIPAQWSVQKGKSKLVQATIDNLTYTYGVGNRLTSVQDAAAAPGKD